MIHLDTHVVLWLAQRDERKLSGVARRLIADNARSVSPVVLLELQFMHEIGRLKATPDDALAAIRSRMTLTVSPAPLLDIVGRAGGLTWTRDPFDRLIVANAIVDGVPLVSADGVVLEHFPAAAW